MALIEHVWPWTQQPQGATASLASWASTPEAWAWTPSTGVVGPHSALVTTGGTVNYGLTAGGVAAQAGNANSIIFGPLTRRIRLGRVAFVTQFVMTSTAQAMIAGCGDNGGYTDTYVEQPFDLNYDADGSTSAGKFRFSIRNASGNATRAAPVSAVLQTGVLHTLVAVPRNGASVNVWLDGAAVPVTYSATSYTEDAADVMQRFNFGILNFFYANTYIWANSAAQVLLMARLTTTAFDGAELSRNPWQLFAPIERRIWVPGEAPGGVPSITAVYAENITATSADYRVTLDYA